MLKGITQHGLLPILGFAFKIGLLIVTAINTYGILYLISQDRLWAVAGLILFEVGLIYWWLVFKNDDKASVIQMAISITMFIACLLLVAAANALHLGAISPDMLGQGTIAKVVIIAVVIQLAASLIYSLASQEHMAALVNQIALGLIWAKAQSNVMANLDQLAEQTQLEIEDRMWQTIQSRVHQTANDRLLTASGERPPVVVEAQPADRVPPAAQPPRLSWRDRLLGRTPAMSNSAYDAPRQAATAAPPSAPGQVDSPAPDPALIAEIIRQYEAARAAAQPVPAPSVNGKEAPDQRP